MSQITILIWNNWSYIKAEDNKRVLIEIDEILSYERETGKFGTITKYSYLTQKGAFPTGFLGRVVIHLELLGFKVYLNDLRKNVIDHIEPVLTLPTGELRPYQQEIVKEIFSTQGWYRGVIDAATNSGKNWIIAACTLSIANVNGKVLITVHRKELFNQLYEFFTECGIVVSLYGTYKKKLYKHIGQVTLAMAKTLHGDMELANVKSELSTVNAVLVDEAHRSGGDEYRKLLTSLEAYIILYFSGTSFVGSDQRDMGMIGRAGELLCRITNQELIDLGISQRPTVYIYELQEFKLGYHYDMEKQNIIESEERLNIIRKYILENLHETILISVQTLEHGEYLLRNMYDIPTTIDFVHGNDLNRAEKIEALKQGVIKVLITTEILKEGVNIPNINCLINASWGKSIVWLKQFVGRLLRSDGVTNECTIIDFIDYGKNTRSHSHERVEHYKNEGFEIIFKKY